MLKILVLVLVLINSMSFAQNGVISEQSKIPKAFINTKFGRITNEHINALFDVFLDELKVNKTQGYIINYGPGREVSRRERIIRNFIDFRDDRAPQITFVRGRFRKEIKTEFWLVPEGVEPPQS